MGDRASHASGSAVTALLEGTRPLLVEIQALAAKAGFGTPQRVATGFDGRRLALLLAVLDKRAGLSFAQLDVFLNVVGGMRLHEPAGDLAVAAALASSVYDRALPADAVFIGEVGLGGEVRPVSQVERRVAEAANMGIAARVSRRARRAEARRRATSSSSACERFRIAHGGCSRDDVQSRATSASSSSPAAAARAGGGTGAQAIPLGRRQAHAAAQPADVHGAAGRGRRSCACCRANYAADPPPWIFQCDVDRLMISPGGRTRTESVANGLDDLPGRGGGRARSRRGAPARRRRDDRPCRERRAPADARRSPRCPSSTRSRRSTAMAASRARSSASGSGARRRRRDFRAR